MCSLLDQEKNTKTLSKNIPFLPGIIYEGKGKSIIFSVHRHHFFAHNLLSRKKEQVKDNILVGSCIQPTSASPSFNSNMIKREICRLDEN